MIIAERTRQTSELRYRRTAEDFTVAAAGFCLIALAYALGRGRSDWSLPVFWIAQLGVFAYFLVRVYRRKVDSTGRAAASALAFALFQYGARWSYSPNEFRFSDELQHFRSAQNVVDTGQLLTANYSLPVSPQFPGLENMTVQIVQVAGLGIFPAGLIVVGLARALLALSLVLLFGRVTNSPRTAAAAALIFLVNPNSGYFDASFVYESLALPFVVLSVYVAVGWAQQRHGRRPPQVLAFLVTVFVVVTTHHVSAVALTVLLALSAIALAAVGGGLSAAGRLSAAALVVLLVLVAWVATVAPSTIAYLQGAASDLVGAITQLGTGAPRDNLQNPTTPLGDTLLAAACVLLTVALLPLAIMRTRKQRDLGAAFCWLGFAYLLILFVRLFAGNGAELATRSWTFVFIPTSLALAYGLSEVERRLALRERITVSVTRAAVLICAAILAGGGIAIGIPPAWERIPGTFNLEGLRSGFDGQALATAQWSAQHLDPGSRFIGDLTATSLNAAYAGLDPVRNPRSVYYSQEFNRSDAQTIRSSAVTYLFVDRRMAITVPIAGRYFPTDIYENKHTTPIAGRSLLKFDSVAGLSRIYDNGTTRVYDVRGSAYAP